MCECASVCVCVCVCVSQVVTLEYRMDLTVATCDTPPVVLGTMPRAWVQVRGGVCAHETMTRTRFLV